MSAVRDSRRARDRHRSPPRERGSHEHRRRREERRRRSLSPAAEGGTRRGKRERSRSPHRRSRHEEGRPRDREDRTEHAKEPGQKRHHVEVSGREEKRERRKSSGDGEPSRREREARGSDDGEPPRRKREGRRSPGAGEPPQRDRESEQRSHKETKSEDRLRRSEREEGGKGEKRKSKEEGDTRRDRERERPSRHLGNGEPADEDTRRGEKAERGREEEKHKSRDKEEEYQFGGKEGAEAKPQTQSEPNFALSGKLTAETNTYKGVVIKYNEPPEARKPKTRWRLYPFKGDETLSTLFIHRQSAYLIGRDRRIVDLAVDHPSCSKQQAVLQYRLVQYQKDSGAMGRKVKPYIIDLESTNGTYVNNQRVEPAKYIELKEKDMIKFGFSSREYVLLHEHSKDDDTDADEGTP